MQSLKSLLVILLICGALSAADPFVGTWKRDVCRSDFGGSSATVKSGGTIYEAVGDGYLYSAELILTDNRVLRLQGLVNFDGKINDGQLDGHSVKLMAQKTDETSYEMRVTDVGTGKALQTFQYTVLGHKLMFRWFDGNTVRPTLTLVYDRQ